VASEKYMVNTPYPEKVTLAQCTQGLFKGVAGTHPQLLAQPPSSGRSGVVD